MQILKIIIVPQNKLFLFMLLLSADFFLKSTFFSKKNSFSNTIRVTDVLDLDHVSVLIEVQII